MTTASNEGALRSGRSTLAEGAGDLVAQRLEQVLQRRALMGLDEGLDRHAGNESDVLETGHLRRRQRDADGVEGRRRLRGILLLLLRIMRKVGGYAGDHAED